MHAGLSVHLRACCARAGDLGACRLAAATLVLADSHEFTCLQSRVSSLARMWCPSQWHGSLQTCSSDLGVCRLARQTCSSDLGACRLAALPCQSVDVHGSLPGIPYQICDSISNFGMRFFYSSLCPGVFSPKMSGKVVFARLFVDLYYQVVLIFPILNCVAFPWNHHIPVVNENHCV